MIRTATAPVILCVLLLSACAAAPGPSNSGPGAPTAAGARATTPLAARAQDSSTPDSPPAGQAQSGGAQSNSAALAPPSSPPSRSRDSERLDFHYWRWWPIIPPVTAAAQQIYQRGLSLNLDRHAFSIIGDCQSMPPVLGGRFDHPGQYQLPAGEEGLQQTIDRFAGSFDRESMTVQNGFSATAALSPLWADPAVCRSGETPLDCELRVHRPVFVIIALGTNWNGDASGHNLFLGQILDRVIAAGAVPILSTKGDNEEGDGSINLGIAQLAAERDLPLWNFWRAIQALPNHGLDLARDGNYLSVDAWDVRSFSALQVLDDFWRRLDPDGVPDPLQHPE